MTPPKFLNSGWPGAFAWCLPWWLCFPGENARQENVPERERSDGRRRGFRVDDIARLDLRRWKLKGLAIATLKPECGGARIRLDGLTYGGFRKEDSPHNAEDFMKALLSLYRGEIVDYEEIPDAGGPPARQEDEERAV